MIRSSSFAALLIALLNLAAVAEASDFVGSDLLVPIAGRTEGAYGSRWQTDLLITNTSRSWTTEEVRVVFRHNGDPDSELHAVIAPRATLVLRDAIRDNFGHENAVGTVRIVAASPGASLSARARIYNTTSQPGEYGQTVQAVAVSKLPREAYLSGLSGLGANRTNVGIASATAEHALAILTLWDREGEMRRGIMVEIPPNGSLVLGDVFAHLGNEPLQDATIHIVSSQPVYAWASIVRSDSGDADFVIASGAEPRQ